MTTLDFQTLATEGGVEWAQGEPIQYDPEGGLAVFKVSEEGLSHVLGVASGLDDAQQADLHKLADFVRKYGSANIYEYATF